MQLFFFDGTNQPNSFYSFKVNKVLILKYTQFIDENVKCFYILQWMC